MHPVLALDFLSAGDLLKIGSVGRQPFKGIALRGRNVFIYAVTTFETSELTDNQKYKISHSSAVSISLFKGT